MYCEKVDFFLASKVILLYRLFFFFSSSLTYIRWLTPNSDFLTFVSSLRVSCVSFYLPLYFLPTLDSSICSPPSHSLFLSHLHTFFLTYISPPTCLAELCPVPCGSHGVCSEGQCQCEEGWTGAACDQRACHPRCEEHGQCHDGTCICQPGWEGEHCNIGELCACGSVELLLVIF